MNEIVMVKGNEVFTTSLAISKGLNLEHESVIRLLKKHSNIEELSRFEIGEIRTKGRPIKIAFLDELQATLLIVLMKNSPEVLKFKIKLTNAFFKQRKLLQSIIIQKQNAEWLLKRNETKVMRLDATDQIKRFIQYAIDQGSKSAHMYYMNISKMELQGLFLMDQKYPNARDVMNFKQLNLIEMADEAVKISLQEGMNAELHYKDIYKLAKSKIDALAKIFPKSPLPLLLSGQKED